MRSRTCTSKTNHFAPRHRFKNLETMSNQQVPIVKWAVRDLPHALQDAFAIRASVPANVKAKNVQQECITQNWPLKCLTHKFLGSYDEAAVKVIRLATCQLLGLHFKMLYWDPRSGGSTPTCVTRWGVWCRNCHVFCGITSEIAL